MSDWERRAGALADALVDSGATTDPALREAFAATPRHVFVPRFYATDEFNSPRTLVDGDDPEQREAWLGAAYADQALITQYEVAGRHDDGTEIRVSTSSASQPSIVAIMLDRLALTGDEKVLEIGTGTGYNAALLCHRLGAERVASIDIDPHLVAEAARRLDRVGYRPVLATRDGASGLPDGAPYDRIIATCATGGIPTAWIEQLAPGGRIVAPLTVGGALAVLSNTGDAEVSGHLDAAQAWFMPLRSRQDPALPATLPEHSPADVEQGSTDVPLRDLTNDDFRLWLRLHLPAVRFVEWMDEGTGERSGLVVHTGAHRADAVYDTGGGRPVVTQDRQRLWDAVEAAWRSWQRCGRPERTRIGLTARTDGTQRVWLDSAESEVSLAELTDP